MQNSSKHFKYLRQLVDDYFEMLDAKGIDYLNHDEADQKYIFSSVKDSFMIEPDDMAVQLGYQNAEAYIQEQIRQEQSTNMSITIEHQMGRFIYHYDGDDMTVYDVMNNQEIVFSVDFDQPTVALLALGVCNTIERYNKSLGGMQ